MGCLGSLPGLILQPGTPCTVGLGWAPPAAVALPRVTPGERGLTPTPEHNGVQSDASHSCALQGIPHTASGAWAHLPCAPVSPIQLFPVRSRAGGRWWQLCAGGSRG